MEVIAGAPPAEFGEKASLVINVTTRSGQGLTTPHGSVTASYGSFGTSNAGLNFGYGGQKWGTSSHHRMNSGRFLDPPEFTVDACQGNEESAIRSRGLSNLPSRNSIHLKSGIHPVHGSRRLILASIAKVKPRIGRAETTVGMRSRSRGRGKALARACRNVDHEACLLAEFGWRGSSDDFH